MYCALKYTQFINKTSIFMKSFDNIYSKLILDHYSGEILMIGGFIHELLRLTKDWHVQKILLTKLTKLND